MSSAQQMMEWLLTGPVRLPSGAYLSWTDSQATGFLYPETAAVAVRGACWWSQTRGDPDLLLGMVPTLAFLQEAVAKEGLVEHRGAYWLFDSLLTLCALESAREAGLPVGSGDVTARLSASCAEMLADECAVRPNSSTRWSTRFGPHLLKPAALVLELEMGSDQLREAIRTAIPKLVSWQQEDGGFRYPQMSAVYLHAHCYALEGLAILGTHANGLRRGLAYLKSQVRADGGVGHWSDSPSPLAADVTAQAGRLFLLADLRELALAARSSLEQLSTPSGALQYHAECSHENSWATAFAAQLDHGLEVGLRPRDLL